ncbi:hypothetical protein LZ30DRAFT_795347, partial [Colletotrichum cereale]
VSMKLGHLARRSADDVSNFRTTDYVPLGHLIDENRFYGTLKEHCPALVIHPPDYDHPQLRRLPKLSPVLDLDIERISEPGMPADFSVPKDPRQWAPAFSKWLLSATKGQQPSNEAPVILSIDKIMFSWPTWYDSPSLVRHFGELVRPRHEVRTIAAAALQEMQDEYGTHIDFRNRNEPAVRDNAFVGVHLRVEKDAIDYHWLSYENQLDYLKQRLGQRKGPDVPVPDTDLPQGDKVLLYVASGDTDGVKRLAKDLPFATIVTKMDILPDATLSGARLRNLTWDQQALVDMLILEHSGYFIGVRDSTFSWHMALRRAAAVNWVVGGYPEDCWMDSKVSGAPRVRSGCKSLLQENEEWRDSLSALVGNGHARVEPQLEITVWP